MHSDKVIINTIERFYPGIIDEVKTKLDEILPAADHDISKLDAIIRLFCQIKLIDMHSIQGRELKRGYPEARKELLAVLLMFYHPQKLYGLCKEKTHYGILLKISEILGCQRNCLSNIIPEIIVHFKTYSQFKSSVTDTYEEIKLLLK